MAQKSDYVGFLPKTFLVDNSRIIGDESTGEVFQIPTSELVPPGDIGALARHFAQFVSKFTGERHMHDDFDPTIYKIQNGNGKVNYVLRVRNLHGDKKEKRQIAVIQKDPECAHGGTLHAYLQEINPQSK